MVGRVRAAVAAAALGVLTSLGGAPPAPAGAGAPVCDTPPAPGQSRTDLPWAQRRLAPDRLAPLADGTGVLVGVLDSGVDTRHPQLAGRVLRGMDFIARGNSGTLDCLGHGTGVASLIAAAPPPRGVAFRGLAPGARILPVRVSERIGEDSRGDTVDPAVLAEAIRWAVRQRVDVLNLSFVLTRDEPPVRAAIAHAVSHDVVVVAAAGNFFDRNNPTPYPAAYPGVLGVGAIGPDGLRESRSQVGPYVDLVAPGVEITVAAPGGGYAAQTGTSYAAPFVAATAALLRQHRPELSAAEVARRIVATADPSAGGRRTGEYGAGVVNPYRALTEEVARGAPEPVATLPPTSVDPAVVAAQARADLARRRAVGLAVAGGALAGLALLVAVVLPRGVRRRWRPAGSG
ncbi:MAG TPA: type VII secretion-associated serine protease mycosin [Pilimelia sp.]|nr:type VII secretion-associated serine protease mycosin [Pilimelia sp.]